MSPSSALALLLTTSSLQASVIHVSYVKAENVKEFKLVLEDKYHFPSSLITYQKVSSCSQATDESLASFCINTNGELRIRKFDQKKMRKSFKIFSQNIRKM